VTIDSRCRRMLRLPAFGKALQARGPGLVLIVPNTPDGWHCARLQPPGDVLVLQLGHDPAAYHWPVNDCEVVLYTECLDPPMVKRTVDALLKAGATVVETYEYRSAQRRAA